MGWVGPVGRECGKCPVHRRAFCARCTPAELTDFEARKFYRHCEPEEVIFWLGEPTEYAATIVSGIATLNQTMPDGRCQIVGLMMPGDFIGNPRRTQASHDVIAATETVLCCIPRRAIQRAMERSPSVIGQLLEMKQTELAALQEWMLLLGRKSAREKVASLLLALMHLERASVNDLRPGPLRLHIRLSREALADYVGLTPETLCRQLSALCRDGVITRDSAGSIAILSVARLSAEACETISAGSED